MSDLATANRFDDLLPDYFRPEPSPEGPGAASARRRPP